MQNSVLVRDCRVEVFHYTAELMSAESPVEPSLLRSSASFILRPVATRNRIAGLTAVFGIAATGLVLNEMGILRWNTMSAESPDDFGRAINAKDVPEGTDILPKFRGGQEYQFGSMFVRLEKQGDRTILITRTPKGAQRRFSINREDADFIFQKICAGKIECAIEKLTVQQPPNEQELPAYVCKVKGYAFERLVGKERIFPVEQIEAFLREVSEGGTGTYNLQFRLPNGTFKVIEIPFQEETESMETYASVHK